MCSDAGQNLGESHAALPGLYIQFQPSPQAYAGLRLGLHHVATIVA